ncbi:hypothetical protein J0A68_15615 [Algoriphagus sp. H41]|uniref:Tetratricopeptide repeat-containing protein n=1 Tax=Algoriphagus oliviformis TaxID=2811231 RepID=A0ABS3C896_9BACT|nr:hypothetical protein [Algoriphagus oliviformis]MBN7812380.1 hypothetical protein [Algoriphagus oliviformis]
MDLQKLIDDYLEGKMSPEDQRLFEDLIEENPKYKAELVQETNGRAALQLAEKRSRKRPGKLRPWLFPALIAVILVLAGYLLWITLGKSQGEKLYAQYYQTLPNQISTAMLGSEHTQQKTEAFKAFEAGDFGRANTIFEGIPLRPDSDYLLLYQGICQLELGRPEKAVPLLMLVKSSSEPASKEVAHWFAALGYFKLNMPERAAQALRVTAANPNPYQQQAKDILQQLD